MHVIGIDQGNQVVGLAWLGGTRGTKPDLHELRTVRGAGTEHARETAAAVLVAIRPWIGGGLDTHVRLEWAPPTARKSVRHGKQAAIGWALGRLAGLIEGGTVFNATSAAVASCECAKVSDWRNHMIALSIAWGVHASHPPPHPPAFVPDPGRVRSVARDGSGFLVSWDGCEHLTPVVDYEALVSSDRVPRCPTCTANHAAEDRIAKDPDEWRRDQWKRLACRLVADHWPEPYAELVADARSRARTEPEDHRLVGVADACEAVWIGLSAWEL